MSASNDFSNDTEFQKLLSRRNDIDITVAALELARDAEPNFDFAPTLEWITERGNELAAPIAQARNDIDALNLLIECLTKTHRLHGTAEDFHNPEGSYLHRAIAVRSGLPITLSLLYMAVGEQLKLPVHCILTNTHTFVRYDSSDGPVYVDPFLYGQVMSLGDFSEWIGHIEKVLPEDISPLLKIASPRRIVIRILNNLKTLFNKNKNWTAAWKVQSRLTALEPVSYKQSRDLAFLAVKTERDGLAITLLEKCLRNCPNEERPLLETQMETARAHLGRWN